MLYDAAAQHNAYCSRRACCLQRQVRTNERTAVVMAYSVDKQIPTPIQNIVYNKCEKQRGTHLGPRYDGGAHFRVLLSSVYVPRTAVRLLRWLRGILFV